MKVNIESESFAGIAGSDKAALSKAEKCGFSIYAQQLVGLNDKVHQYNALGKLTGIAEKLGIASFEDGIKGTKEDIDRRQEIFGQNT